MPFGSGGGGGFNGGTTTTTTVVRAPGEFTVEYASGDAVMGADGTNGFFTAVDGSGRTIQADVTGAIILSPESGGVLFTAPHAAPADGLITTGGWAFWLDQTPAATKLMIKAKDSGGTVRTASIALA